MFKRLSVPNPYRELFKAPGATGFVLAGAIARLPLPMIGIGIITMLSEVRGSYALAGAVAATFALATALLAPRISRLVDRHGQGRVLPIAATICVAALICLAACVQWSAPDWTLFLFAALAGTLPSMPAMIRARWTEIFRDQPQLRTAYALESVADELSFILGPPLAVGLSVALFPQAGPLAAALLLALGVTAFVLQRATAPSVQVRQAGREASVLRMPSMRALVAMMSAMGVIVGTIDVLSVAFARAQGVPAGASLVLSAYALGSCVAGLVFGVMKFQMPLARMLSIAAAVTAFTTVPLLWVDDLITLSLGVLLAGLSFAPTMIIAMALVETSVPGQRLTEGLTWLVTGLGAGVAAGAAMAGWVVDHYGVQAGFWTAVGAGAVVLLVALPGGRARAAASAA
ncbi:MFS transporter [Achromobacter spanius]|uniref:MFS transporter n=1 Tax=Achromobacter spanius TaxID=217203 RepID=A0ABY8GYG2_9BURK|nr:MULTISPECIES: MFS transporter [Achromobacter]WAI80836.1 MFS transporter [Achromobacter spanius]WEX96349.1 MFS transporter [Achromobacter sp. SS2-2022]WFP09930.1 MFS transporter [Achromobacter spanius]